MYFLSVIAVYFTLVILSSQSLLLGLRIQKRCCFTPSCLILVCWGLHQVLAILSKINREIIVMNNVGNKSKTTYRFSRRVKPQPQNWAHLTYLHSKPRNTYIYPMQERQDVRNTSWHEVVVMWLLNLPCCSLFSYLENFKRLFWKIIIFAVVTLFFWRSNISNT